jgi:hypothetical protein
VQREIAGPWMQRRATTPQLAKPTANQGSWPLSALIRGLASSMRSVFDGVFGRWRRAV